MMDAIAIFFVFALVFVVVFLAIFALLRRKEERDSKIIHYINSYPYPNKIVEELMLKYPHLSDDDIQLVTDALKQYFVVCHIVGRSFVSMPSKAVDIAWHELILFTKIYRDFCINAFGRFLHHTPAEAMKKPTVAQEGIKRAWRVACMLEGINPRNPGKLPLLFAIDGLLNIPDGYTYKLNCNPAEGEYCAGAIGCSSGTEKGCVSE